MAQNQAHIGDTVSPIVGELKGKHGQIIALRVDSNLCMVRIPFDAIPTDHANHVENQYDGAEVKLIKCFHMGIMTSGE